MTAAGFESIAGATPLDADAIAGLKLSYVTTQVELNAAEEANILAALNWTRRARRRDLLQLEYVLELHRRMFGDVWSWAGTWRQRDTNLGVSPLTIPSRTEGLLNDVRYWIENTIYHSDEIGVRLHHQLVAIHPFPNGNGRHTRMLADLLVAQLSEPVFTWGGRSLSLATDVRKTYISALRNADGGNIGPLLAFARS